MYKNLRQSFYSSIENFWYDLYDGEYALYHHYLLSDSDINEIRDVTEKVGKVFFKTARLLRRLKDEQLTALGIPKETLKVVRMRPINIESVIARLDLVKTDEGLKVLEINSDTPTFILESFEINEYVCRHFGVENPNKDMTRHLSGAVNRAIYESAIFLELHEPNIVFTAHDDNIEDWNTVAYLRSFSNVPSKLHPLDVLFIDENGLYDGDGKKIDILYRHTYPLEHLMLDESDSGEKIGLRLLKLVEEKKLAIINPPSAFLLQSKGIQALIWSLYENDIEHNVFTVEEKEIIGRHMLPTYLSNESFLGTCSFVKKPSFGREGGTVEIFDNEGILVTYDANLSYKDELPIYQKYVEMPKITLETNKGSEELSLLIGSFLIGGKASAFAVRAGGKITDNNAYYLPVGFKK